MTPEGFPGRVITASAAKAMHTLLRWIFDYARPFGYVNAHPRAASIFLAQDKADQTRFTSLIFMLILLPELSHSAPRPMRSANPSGPGRIVRPAIEYANSCSIAGGAGCAPPVREMLEIAIFNCRSNNPEKEEPRT
jgi:hypothetical protein